MKKTTLKVLSLALAGLTATACFTACNGKQTADDIKEYGAWKGEQIFETSEDDIKNYTFRVSAFRDFGSDPLNRPYADGADKYLEKHPGAKVEYLTIGDHQPDAIAAAVASGDVWDIQYVFTCSQMPGDIVDGLYEPIDGYFNLDDERIDKNTSMGAYFDGHYYGVSNAIMQECMYLSYNENMFKANGIKTPHEYYAEGKWNFDSLFEMVTALHEKGLDANFGSFMHPAFILKYATQWNEDYTDVKITLGDADVRQYLDKCRTIIYDYGMVDNGASSNNPATRNAAVMAAVVPNVVELAQNTETDDTIRYIFYPGFKEGEDKPHLNVADANFMTPAGSNQTMKAAALDLAMDMGMGRKNNLLEYYKKCMTEEDYKLLLESFEDCRPLSRGFSPNFMYYNFNFGTDMKSGKPVSTYVSEYKALLETHAENFRKKMAEYREYTGLSEAE